MIERARWNMGVAWLLVAICAAVVGAGPAMAHTDPPGSNSTGITISLTAFLADGTTPALGQDLTDCESILYQATLSWANSPNASFEGGTWTITTPDGVVHDVTPGGGIPCIGDPINSIDDGAAPGGRGACSGTPGFLQSAQIPYTVQPGHILGGMVSASTSLAGAFAHIGDNDIPGAGGFTPLGLPVEPCVDNLFCSSVVCDPGASFGDGRLGACVATEEQVCPPDLFQCSTAVCDEESDSCVPGEDTSDRCGTSDACVDRGCDDATGCFVNDHSAQCGSSDACVDRGCDPVDGCFTNDHSAECGTSDACVDRGCDPVDGCFTDDHSSECGSDETCVLRGCDPVDGCFEEDPDPLPEECMPLGCRITAGGISPDGEPDAEELAGIRKATFGGQVGAPCGCIGCFDELDHVQGSWTHSRKSRRGSFHAMDYNSLVCGCDGVFDGELCNPDDRDPGPEPRPAPANMACWSGIGDFNPTNGRRTIRVAFRVEVEDRSEPGAGKNAPDDVYVLRIWIPNSEESVEVLADQACCTNAEPTGREPDVHDGGDLIHDNIQIHPVLPHTEDGVCPVPDGMCQE